MTAEELSALTVSRNTEVRSCFIVVDDSEIIITKKATAEFTLEINTNVSTKRNYDLAYAKARAIAKKLGLPAYNLTDTGQKSLIKGT